MRTRSLILALALLVGWGAAQGASHVDVVMVAPEGVIVGVGTVGEDGLLALQVLEGYTGAATLIATAEGSSVPALSVELADGRFVAGEPDLRALLASLGVPGLVLTAVSASPAAPAAGGPPASPPGRPDAPGSGNNGRGPPATPPGQGGEPPGKPPGTPGNGPNR